MFDISFYTRSTPNKISKLVQFIPYLLYIVEGPEATYNEQKTTWKKLKRPTTSKKLPETTWSNLPRARKDLKQPTTSKKQLKTIYNNLKRPTTSKKRSTTTCNEQILTSLNPFTSKIINWRASVSQRRHQ